MKIKNSIVGLVTLLGLGVSASHGDLYFYDAGGGSDTDIGTAANWNPDGNPGGADLAVINNSFSATSSGDFTADSLRLSNNGNLTQSAGIVTIETGVGPDNGLWVSEFGPGVSSYTINGGVLNINDAADGFMVGRSGGSSGVFNLNGGTVNNLVGDTHIGLDGTSVWNQSSGTFNGAGVQIGRFQSPTATVNLSGDAVWDTGLVLLSDGFLGSATQSDLNITGGNVSFQADGLVMKSIANITFNGTGGISSMDLNGGQFLLNDGELYLESLPSASLVGETIALIENIGSFTGLDTEFDNAPDGTVVGDWEVDYTGSGVNLVAVVPEPSSYAILAGALALSLALVRRRS